MWFWNRLKISKKILFSIVVIALTLTVSFVCISIATIRSMGKNALEEKGASLAIITGETIKASVQYSIGEETGKVLRQLLAHDTDVSIAAVVIKGPHGAYLVTSHEAKNGYETVKLEQTFRELEAHRLDKRDEILILGDDKLLLLASRIDLVTNESIQGGYLLLALNDRRISHQISSSSQSIIGLGVLLVALGITWAFFIARAITRPLSVALSVANAISAGDLQTDVTVSSSDEIGQLMAAMKQMVATIRLLIADFSMLTDAAIAGQLATRVNAAKHRGDFQKIVMGVNATLDAVIGPLNMSAEYVDRISKGDIPPKITTTYYGDFNEIKLNLNNCVDIMTNLLHETTRVLLAAADGKLDERANAELFIGDWRQMVLGINNIVTNIVNPLRITTELLNKEVGERRKAQELLLTQQHQLESLNTELEERVADEVVKNREKDQALMQSEKLASIGQLAAGVAHEINNPMGYISSNLRVLAEYFDLIVRFDGIREEYIQGEMRPESRTALQQSRCSLEIENIMSDGADLINESLVGAERVTKIVKDLKSFSRVDVPEYEMVSLESCLESALNICYNELKYVATIRKVYEPMPEILCHPGQLNQVFLNLLINAGQAISPPGEIVISCWHDAEFVYASVSDTGKGIPDEIRNRIFNPFLTTKDVGQGTGLGLSISYEIIRKHQGEIQVKSSLGKGAVFTVKLPQTRQGGGHTTGGGANLK